MARRIRSLRNTTNDTSNKTSTTSNKTSTISNRTSTISNRTSSINNKSAKKVDNRKRNFAFVLYDDSAAPDWQEELENQHVPYFYIYHDKDKNPDGTQKKEHYHVMIMFEGKKSDKQIQEFASLLGVANNKIEVVNSIRSYARYLIHMDNPERYQYDSSLVKAGGGADYQAIIGLPSDRYKIIKEMISFCKTENVLSYSDLLEYAMVHQSDWFKVLCDNGTIVMKEYLKSREWTMQRYNKNI